VILSSTAILSALILGQNSASIRFMPPIGKPYRYVMTMKMSQTMSMPGSKTPMPNTDMTMIIPTTMKATKRSGLVTTLETSSGQMKLLLPPNSILSSQKSQIEKAAAPRTISMDMDASFKILRSSGPGSTATTAFQSISFPNHPIRVGEAWSAVVDLSKFMGASGVGGASPTAMTGKLPTTYKLLSLSGSGAKAVAKIAISMKGKITVTASGQAVPVNIDGTGVSTFEISSGMVAGSQMTMNTFVKMPQMSMKQTMHQSMVRQ
jgi:hypothetical protein